MGVFSNESEQKGKRKKKEEEIDLKKNSISLINSINKYLIELEKELNK